MPDGSPTDESVTATSATDESVTDRSATDTGVTDGSATDTGVADTGSVVTVEGPVAPETLGVTLPHEHVFSSWSAGKFREPDSAYERHLARQPISLDTLWYVRRNPTRHRGNLRMESFEDAVTELGYYYRAGGDTLVDVTPKGTAGDPSRVRGVARETGVTVVHGTAFYTRDTHPDRIENATVAELADEFVGDVREGIGDTDVRAGILGEIGTSGAIHDREEVVLRAAARASLRTGAPVSVHPPSDRDPEWPPSRRALQILDVLEAEGLPLDRVAVCHMDQSKWLGGSMTYQREILDRGAYVEFDLFGHELYFADAADAQPSDVDRAGYVADLVEDGYAEQLLLSQDIFLKHLLRTYGGHGYAHILTNVLPMFDGAGVPDDVVNRLLTDNPQRMLTFAEPQ
jgi:phosphotriesterase-related protein